jgi:hypothetical protein
VYTVSGLEAKGSSSSRNVEIQVQQEKHKMLGDMISETTGKRIVRRVLSTDPPKVEVSFEDSGSMMGVATTGFGTYESMVHTDGSIYGEGQGVTTTADGEVVTWKGSALGKFGANGAVSYRGILYFRTASQKLAQLNAAPGVFEYEVDPTGNTHSKVWTWQ